MSTYIALLKGINVGGHKKVPMAELRELFSQSGFKNVRTYIQSGNVILQSSEKSNLKIEKTVKEAITNYFGFEVSVLVKTRQDLQRIFNNSPFSEDEKKASYFIMLHNTPDKELVKITSEKIYEGEAYQIIEDFIYYYSANGFGQSKFDAKFFERKLNTYATARNYNTMLKLLSLSVD
ncbi:DUF1697 domain-containing protein [Pontimicrobium aquaticum]|uniref:DUF1697 domain-containing protein n=1 Tax=Pontimicrobium aquaticum TaxID=2565367 RepID=A0A4U0F258_9FLAO|nr:DUF1697 domain-containing protein [Pontimicrobium aquaticum]TJY37864.1 DUF1697 domain-containing protein [Pontimicrobium aquaticum]